MRTNITAIAMLLASTLSACAQGESRSVSILGDSYSTFEGFLKPDTNEVWYFDRHDDPKRTDVFEVEQTWWHQLISKRGFRLCQNNSYSGATISYTGYRGEDYSPRSFNTRLDNLGCPDIILVFGATNDSWAGAPIGEYEYEDFAKEKLYSFRPAMALMLRQLKRHYPNVDIYFILNDGLREEISESCRVICRHYGITCIELSGIHKLSGHPSVKGMSQIAEQVSAVVK